MALDRNTPGLDPTSRQQLVDLDQDNLIKILQDKETSAESSLKALVLSLQNLDKRLKELENKPKPQLEVRTESKIEVKKEEPSFLSEVLALWKDKKKK